MHAEKEIECTICGRTTEEDHIPFLYRGSPCCEYCFTNKIKYSRLLLDCLILITPLSSLVVFVVVKSGLSSLDQHLWSLTKLGQGAFFVLIWAEAILFAWVHVIELFVACKQQNVQIFGRRSILKGYSQFSDKGVRSNQAGHRQNVSTERTHRSAECFLKIRQAMAIGFIASAFILTLTIVITSFFQQFTMSLQLFLYVVLGDLIVTALGEKLWATSTVTKERNNRFSKKRFVYGILMGIVTAGLVSAQMYDNTGDSWYSFLTAMGALVFILSILFLLYTEARKHNC